MVYVIIHHIFRKVMKEEIQIIHLQTLLYLFFIFLMLIIILLLDQSYLLKYDFQLHVLLQIYLLLLSHLNTISNQIYLIMILVSLNSFTLYIFNHRNYKHSQQLQEFHIYMVLLQLFLPYLYLLFIIPQLHVKKIFHYLILYQIHLYNKYHHELMVKLQELLLVIILMFQSILLLLNLLHLHLFQLS